MRRIGFLIGGPPALIDAFKTALTAHGHIEGENLDLDIRVATAADAERHAEELAKSDVELVVAAALPFALDLRDMNPNKPMVIATCPGMVSNGFAESLERPGGIVTGMEELAPGVTARRLTLLKALAPGVSRVALLSTTPGRGGHEMQVADAEAIAPALGVTVQVYRATSLPALEDALAAMVRDKMNGLANFQGGLSLEHRKVIVDFAAEHRLPAVYQATLFPESGGLMAWAPDLEEQFRVAARYVHQILEGARPGELPILHPARYFWTVNETAARGLGIELSADVRATIDRVLT
jgi:putative tryptophan/tyrosine transport system substrate-binding protein